jgi:hypothetical protein
MPPRRWFAHLFVSPEGDRRATRLNRALDPALRPALSLLYDEAVDLQDDEGELFEIFGCGLLFEGQAGEAESLGE